MNASLEQWLATRPQAVQDCAKKHPIGTRYLIDGKVAHIISYDEMDDDTVCLGVSFIDPREDYDGAVASRFSVCADHFDEEPR